MNHDLRVTFTIYEDPFDTDNEAVDSELQKLQL